MKKSGFRIAYIPVGFCIVICLFAVIFICATRYTFSDKVVRDIVQKVDLTEIYLQGNLPDAGLEGMFGIPSEYAEMLKQIKRADIGLDTGSRASLSVAEYLYTSLFFIDFESPEHLNRVYKASTIPEFVSQFIIDRSGYYWGDNPLNRIYADDLTNLVNENNPLLKSETGFEVPDWAIDKLLPVFEVVVVSMNNAPYLHNINMTSTVLYGFAAVAFVLFLLLFMLCRKDIGLFIGVLGIVITFLGMINLMLGFGSTFILAEEYKFLQWQGYLIGLIAQPIIDVLRLTGFVCIGAGILMAVVGPVARSRKQISR